MYKNNKALLKGSKRTSAVLYKLCILVHINLYITQKYVPLAKKNQYAYLLTGSSHRYLRGRGIGLSFLRYKLFDKIKQMFFL